MMNHPCFIYTPATPVRPTRLFKANPRHYTLSPERLQYESIKDKDVVVLLLI